MKSKEIFEIGDVVTWGDYIPSKVQQQQHGDGPFTISEVHVALDPRSSGHTQLVTLYGIIGVFSGLWFKKVSKYRHIELLDI